MTIDKSIPANRNPDFKSIIEDIKKNVEPAIQELLNSYVDKKTKKIIEYQIANGGKKLRSSLTIISCRMLGGKTKDVLYPAAALEILHNYSLIIDDIIDHSLTRRNKPTLWAKYGSSIAQCIAIDYGASLFQSVLKAKNQIKLIEIFSKTLKTLVDGEILDILFEQAGREDEPYIVKHRYRRITEKDYFEMVIKKTAFLFQTCCQVGGICANARPKEIDALRKYGLNLGIAFQIRDDILDIFGEEKEFGKKIGKDIEERKGGNIVIIYANQEFSRKEKKIFKGILTKKNINQKDIQKAIILIQKTKARERAQKLGRKFTAKAKRALESLPQNKWNKILNEIADFTIERSY